jgi:hypothetical protein
VRYTGYFYRKYYSKYAARTGLRVPRELALAMYSVFVIYREYLRPFAHRAALFALRQRRARKALSPPPSDPPELPPPFRGAVKFSQQGDKTAPD